MLGVLGRAMAPWTIGRGFFIALATFSLIAGETSIPDFKLGEKYEREDSEWPYFSQGERVGVSRAPKTS